MILAYSIGGVLLAGGVSIVRRTTSPPAANIGLALSAVGLATVLISAAVQVLR